MVVGADGASLGGHRRHYPGKLCTAGAGGGGFSGGHFCGVESPGRGRRRGARHERGDSRRFALIAEAGTADAALRYFPLCKCAAASVSNSCSLGIGTIVVASGISTTSSRLWFPCCSRQNDIPGAAAIACGMAAVPQRKAPMVFTRTVADLARHGARGSGSAVSGERRSIIFPLPSLPWQTEACSSSPGLLAASPAGARLSVASISLSES